MKIIITICFLVCLTYGSTSYSQTVTNEVTQGSLETDLFPDGKIYFVKENDAEPDDSCQTIAFMLEYKQDNQFKKND